MTRKPPAQMTSEELLKRYIEIGVAQDDAIDRRLNLRFKRLFQDMTAVEQELQVRASDERRLLMRLYQHSNMQVQLNAAKATLAVAPAEARRQLETIAASRHFPQAGDAGMSLWALDNGIFKPE